VASDKGWTSNYNLNFIQHPLKCHFNEVNEFFRNPKLFHNFIHLLPVNAVIGLFVVNEELMDVYVELVCLLNYS
jgi:hypothetical protein